MGNYASKAGAAGANATNARQIENMNEAQLNKEIQKAKKEIAAADKTMSKNAILDKEMQKAFPLGVGGDGWTEQRRMAREKGLERDARKAKTYTEAYDKKEAAQTRLETLEKAKNEIKGTGKTQKQINTERVKKTVSETPKTLKWTTTQKGGWVNGGYAPKIIKAGNIEIHGTDGLYSVYDNGKLIGRTNKLSTAKAAAEKLIKSK